MEGAQRIEIKIDGPSPPKSLCWMGDDLVDLVSGATRYHLNGHIDVSRVYYAFPFSRAITSADGRFQILYANLGTKALLLEHGKILRELNRSYYFANAYEFPIAFLRTPDGRDVLVHCPDEYCQLEIEDVLSGERLTRRDSKPADFFHSRLQATADGRFLLTSGWVWHPLDLVKVFAVENALRDPATLDGHGLDLPSLQDSDDAFFEMHSAAFSGNERLIIAGAFDDGSANRLCVVDLQTRSLLANHPLATPAGTLMPIGDQVVCFYDHPRLLDLSTGKLIAEWPELMTGAQNSSILRQQEIPPFALDPQNRRFAIGGKDRITVIQLPK